MDNALTAEASSEESLEREGTVVEDRADLDPGESTREESEAASRLSRREAWTEHFSRLLPMVDDAAQALRANLTGENPSVRQRAVEFVLDRSEDWMRRAEEIDAVREDPNVLRPLDADHQVFQSEPDHEEPGS